MKRTSPYAQARALRVGLDYLPAVSHAPGVGRYARELVRALAQLDHGPRLSLFEWGVGPRPMEGPPLGLENAQLDIRRRRFPLPRRLLELAHRFCGLGADDLLGGIDVFHRILPGQPALRRVHQVLPIVELPAEGSPSDRSLAQAVEQAGAIVVFCADYAKRVPQRYGIDPARVAQASVGAEHWLRDRTASGPIASARDQPEPESSDQILVLGALRQERRPLLALEGFERLLAGGGRARLCLVGRPSSAADSFRAALERSPAASAVRWIDDPVEAEMPGLVAQSKVLLHLAQDEGSAVTPLEACAMGLAIAAERLPAFEEVLGSEAAWIDRAAGPEQVADALAQALGPAQAAARNLARKRIAEAHSWSLCAQQHIRIWEAVARGDRPLPAAEA